MDLRRNSVFNEDCFCKLMSGLKLFDTNQDVHEKASAFNEGCSGVADPLCKMNVSDAMACSCCDVKFSDKVEQRQHYKMDWHRFNLKQKLRGLEHVTEKAFVNMSGNASTDSETEIVDDDSSETFTTTTTEADYESTSSDFEIERQSLTSVNYFYIPKNSRVYFVNGDKNIVSVYRCLLHGKKDAPPTDDRLVSMALRCPSNAVWAIIILGGGHFAAGIFRGDKVEVHKTFHSYTVRASQGSSQSRRDARSEKGHPKSAGASLRRYNEAALIQHVQNVLAQWKSNLEECNLIFIHAVGHNQNVLFGGRSPPFRKQDARLRNIPFPTKRATFNEIVRVHGELSQIQVYGSVEAFYSQIQTKNSSKEVNILVGKVDALEKDASEDDIKMKGDLPYDTSNESGSPKRNVRKNIDHAKPQRSTDHPLPEIVKLLAQSSPESSDAVCDAEEDTCMVYEDVEMSVANELTEFENTVPKKRKDKKMKKVKQISGTRDKHKLPGQKETCNLLPKKLLAACKLDDLALLKDCLSSYNDEQVPETLHFEKQELCTILNESVTSNGNTLLHIAAQEGNVNIIRCLMEAGADPSVKNKMSQTPFAVSANKEVRDGFRRFMADFPEKFDYCKSQIPGPLTNEMESVQIQKKKAHKKMKRDRVKERKKEKVTKIAEEAVGKEFGDEKESELAKTYTSVVENRCCQCAKDIANQDHFHYSDYIFCSINCLKVHRLSQKVK